MKITCPNARARSFFVGLLGLALSAGASVALAQDEGGEGEPEQPAAPASTQPATAEPAAAGETPALAQEKILTREEHEKAWHEKTPASIARRLFLGAGVGLGTGKGPEKAYSSDHLGGEVFAQYHITPSADALGLLVEGRYATITGVNTDLDESQVVQSFLVGGGVAYRFSSGAPTAGVAATPTDSAGTSADAAATMAPEVDVATLPYASKNRLGMQALFLAGITKRRGHSQDTGADTKSKYGANAALEARCTYALWNRIDAYAGVGARVVGYSWYDVKLGAMASF